MCLSITFRLSSCLSLTPTHFFQSEILLSIPHKLIYLSIYKPQPDSTLGCRIRYVECTRTYMHTYIHTTLWTTQTSECLSKTLKTDEIVSPIADERTGTYDTPAAPSTTAALSPATAAAQHQPNRATSDRRSDGNGWQHPVWQPGTGTDVQTDPRDDVRLTHSTSGSSAVDSVGKILVNVWAQFLEK